MISLLLLSIAIPLLPASYSGQEASGPLWLTFSASVCAAPVVLHAFSPSDERYYRSTKNKAARQ